MKATHRKILNKIEAYLNTDGAEHLRFTQALFNLGINQFDPNTEFTFRDNHNDSDEEIIGKIIMSQEREVPVIPVMKQEVQPNTLYYVEDYITGKLIDENQNLTVTNVKSVRLDGATTERLLELLVDDDSGMMHKCISVYRDAIIINGNVYNLCLSCGDYYINDKRICIFTHNEIKELLAPFKN